MRVSKGFQGFPEVSDRRLKQCQKNAVWIGVRRLCHAAKTKKEYKGIWSLYESSPKFSRGISGLVVEYIVAIDVTRVRSPADAHCSHESVRADEMAR